MSPYNRAASATLVNAESVADFVAQASLEAPAKVSTLLGSFWNVLSGPRIQTQCSPI